MPADTRSTTRTIYRNCSIFTAGEQGFAESLVVEGDRLAWVGDAETAERMAGDSPQVVDLAGSLVVPGFIDAHTHLMMMGQSLQKVGLVDAGNLEEIQRRLLAAREAAPDAELILGVSWLFDHVPGGTPTRQMLDDAIADIPVYLDANDFHSCWVNTAALREMGITKDTPDPIGGTIVKDPTTGEPTGLLLETAAQQHVWSTLAAKVSDEERDDALARTFSTYLAAGVTGGIDMALNELDLQALDRAQSSGGGTLPIRVVGHWFIERTDSAEGNVQQVDRAIGLAKSVCSPWLRVAGIKIVVDGVIDACTAAMTKPFADGSLPGPIWDLESLVPVVTAADAAGLQIAIHAIGDEASDIALTALERAYSVNGARVRRHRIEHLEVVKPENVERLARLGVVASMQPVHADPAIQSNWRSVLGDDRVDRGYPWPEFTDAGARLAFGTDAPTAPYPALPNLFVAATRRSALDPTLEPNISALAVPLSEAIGHATRDAAWSCGAETDLGRLETGMLADFTVIDTDPFVSGVESLLDARIVRTVVGGKTSFAAASD
ncbi:amidohydrolase [Saxibacter everestensis]|uniref:Amidohydrolase n=1 Tax=Saxibacter everestensis TaxID=2909229 RepID=A0ABY8QZC3_9MICO|nr:amidohydrolase [Brevibacteriaceae bacterium ZFBP1038]